MKPLGEKERKIILAAALYERKRGQAPTWTELQKIVGVDRRKIRFVITGLRRKGLVTFEDDVSRSLRIRPESVVLALGKERW